MAKWAATVVAFVVITTTASAGMLIDEPMGVSPDIAEQVANDVSELFADPETVQIRRVRLNIDKSSICGQYNAKNAFGGYVGFKPFKYIIERRKVYADISSCS